MSTSTDNRFMEFKLSQQSFAIPLLTVKEVIPRPEITPVPNMPPHFEGMFNLRGQILGVFNIRKKLGAKPKEAGAETHEVIIVIEKDGISAGVVVDEVTRVVNPEQSQIKAAPLKDDDPSAKYIGSVIQMDDQLIMTVRIEQVLEFEKYKDLLRAA
ncbi:MAG: chemotaxis protein CheW [Bdellovibrionales bacterium]|nr:chemotaxis protein CheW [Bdellovibrionales bacterium]